jgi:hypothetical protein
MVESTTKKHNIEENSKTNCLYLKNYQLNFLFSEKKIGFLKNNK